MLEINRIRAVIAMHTMAAISIGLVSTKLEPWMAGLMGFVVLLILGMLTSRMVSKKLWLSNGLMIYLFLWFVSWVLFYNL